MTSQRPDSSAAASPDQDRQTRLERLSGLAEGLLLGLACGDALGLPWELRERGTFRAEGMAGFGTHGQPAGTWSTDTSLALIQAASLRPGGSDVDSCARKLLDWYHRGFFTAGGAPFDVGAGTARAIACLPLVRSPELAGCTRERDSDSVCLVRMAPMALALLGTESAEMRYDAVRTACSVTHAHPLSLACSFVYVEFARHLCLLGGKDEAYQALQDQFSQSARRPPAPGFPWKLAQERLARVFDGRVRSMDEGEVASGHFVVHTLEAALWCLLGTAGYSQAVLKAVNLGGGCDTTAAAAGALAGLLYGAGSIPAAWRQALAREGYLRLVARQSAEMALGLRRAGRLETDLN